MKKIISLVLTVVLFTTLTVCWSSVEASAATTGETVADSGTTTDSDEKISKITDLFEALTIFCFGLSWPISIRKSLISKTAKGKSLFFEVFLLIGYAFGIARKIIQVVSLDASGFLFYLSFFFYILNFVEITIDVLLYFRNTKLDKMRENGSETV